MLNVYDKFDNPKELVGYDEKYLLLTTLGKLKGIAATMTIPVTRKELTEEEKDVLSKNLNMVLRTPADAYYYTLCVVKGRFEPAEPIIMTNAHFAVNYAMLILKSKWKEAEPVIFKDDVSRDRYFHFINKLR